MIRATPLGDRSEEQTVRRIAALARLELSAQEVEVFGAQLASVLAAFESLAGAPVDHVAPLTSPADDGAGSGSWPREDRLEPGLERDALMERAPRTAEDGRLFEVPPAIAPEAEPADDGERRP